MDHLEILVQTENGQLGNYKSTWGGGVSLTNTGEEKLALWAELYGILWVIIL